MKIQPYSAAIVVKDRKRAAKWYSRVLGLKVLENDPEHWTVVGRKGSGLRIHLCQQDDGRGPTSEEADTGILLLVDKPLVKAHKALVKAGVDFAVAPTERPWGWVSKIRDPDGNVFTLLPEE
ncbi:MAG TPA: VOC family protein [Thermoplasmata archaeon]|nr:VOC family protein [Thermoplasmata archaeon]